MSRNQLNQNYFTFYLLFYLAEAGEGAARDVRQYRDDWDSDFISGVLEELQVKELIVRVCQDSPREDYKLTERGRVFVDQMMLTDLPQQTWGYHE